MALQGDNLPLTIWHFDFYRFNDPSEWEDAGFRDIFASLGLKLIEWPAIYVFNFCSIDTICTS